MGLLKKYSSDSAATFTIITLLSEDLAYFETYLKSLLSQEHHQLTEVLLLSTINTKNCKERIEQILFKYKDQLQKRNYYFCYFDNHENKNKSYLVNKGVDLANGTWIYLLHDSHQVLKSTFLEFEAAIQESPKIDLITGRFHYINQTGKIIKKSPELALEGGENHKFQDFFLYTNPLSPVSTLYKKSVWQRSQGLDLCLNSAGEWDLLRRLSHRSLIPNPRSRHEK